MPKESSCAILQKTAKSSYSNQAAGRPCRFSGSSACAPRTDDPDFGVRYFGTGVGMDVRRFYSSRHGGGPVYFFCGLCCESNSGVSRGARVLDPDWNHSEFDDVGRLPREKLSIQTPIRGHDVVRISSQSPNRRELGMVHRIFAALPFRVIRHARSQNIHAKGFL